MGVSETGFQIHHHASLAATTAPALGVSPPRGTVRPIPGRRTAACTVNPLNEASTSADDGTHPGSKTSSSRQPLLSAPLEACSLGVHWSSIGSALPFGGTHPGSSAPASRPPGVSAHASSTGSTAGNGSTLVLLLAAVADGAEAALGAVFTREAAACTASPGLPAIMTLVDGPTNLEASMVFVEGQANRPIVSIIPVSASMTIPAGEMPLAGATGIVTPAPSRISRSWASVSGMAAVCWAFLCARSRAAFHSNSLSAMPTMIASTNRYPHPLRSKEQVCTRQSNSCVQARAIRRGSNSSPRRVTWTIRITQAIV